MSALHVRMKWLDALKAEDVEWLLAGGDGGGSSSNTSSDDDGDSGAGSAPAPTGSSPLVLGFDTELVVDALSLIQLGNADRVLLVRVPAAGSVAKRGRGAPATCPALRNVLTSPTTRKAAAEAWQDVLMVLHGMDIGMAGCVCLSQAYQDRFKGKFKLGLFAMFERLCPGSGLEKDKATTTSDWAAERLTEEQVRYAALDAFVSWAVAAACPTAVEKVSLKL